GQVLGSIVLLFGITMYGQFLPFNVILTANFLAGICAGIQTLIFLGSTILFVPRERLLKYNGLIQVFRATPQILSPLVALPLLGLVKIEGLLILDIVTFTVGIVGVLATSF